MSSLSNNNSKKKKNPKKNLLKTQKISKKRKRKGQVQDAPTGFFLRFRLQKILILQDC